MSELEFSHLTEKTKRLILKYENFFGRSLEELFDQQWSEVSQDKNLTEEFIEHYKNQLDWNWISALTHLSEDFLIENKERVNWKQVSRRMITSVLIPYVAEEIGWTRTTQNHIFLKEDIINFSEKLDWEWINTDRVMKRLEMTEDLVVQFKEKLDMNIVSRHHKVPERLLEEFQEDMDWGVLFQNGYITEGTLRTYQHRLSSLDWMSISVQSKLSEEFIVEFFDRLNKKGISRYGVFSFGFLQRNIEKLDIEELIQNSGMIDGFSEEEKQKFVEMIKLIETFQG